MKDLDGSSSPVTPDRRSMDYQDAVRQRYQSGVSDFMTAPIPEDELRRATSRSPQGPGALPTLDLGLGIENDVPTSFISKDPFYRVPHYRQSTQETTIGSTTGGHEEEGGLGCRNREHSEIN